ncbi:MAG: RagB/SusD family nutrient uptake outer membrane protein [Cyclobacteriaceae bacterium]
MRRIYILLTCLAVIQFQSCETLLEIEEEGQITGDVLSDAGSIQKALIGAYYNIGGTNDGGAGGELFGGDFILVPTLLAHLPGQEYIWTSSQATDYLVFTERDGNPNVKIIANNARVQANWVRAYETINTVNSILQNLDKISDAGEKSRIEGECLAIRGMLYFEMVRLWGPDYQVGSNTAAIPLLVDPILKISEIATPTLATVAAVYTQVEEDLTTASTLLQALGRNGTGVNYYACQSYLTRLAMHKRDFVAAIGYADNVINNAAYNLMPEPYMAFNNANNSTEDIFAIQQSLNNNSGDRTSGTGIVSFMSSLRESGIGQFAIISSSLNNDFLLNSPIFNIGDKRAGFITSADANTSSGDLGPALLYNNVANEDNSIFSSAKFTSAANVIPVVRLAELYLLRAEAVYQTSGVTQGAVDDLNMIRTRASIPAVSLADFTDPTVFFDSIKLETKREFVYEGHLLHNLRRWEDLIGNNFQKQDPLDNMFLWDIPQSEQDTWID